MKTRVLLIASLLILAANTFASSDLAANFFQMAQAPSSNKSRCAELCANTPTGEEPWVIEEREAEIEHKKLLESGSYKEIWARYPIFSTTKEIEWLTLPLDRATGLQIRLAPKTGRLYMEKKGVKQVFGFASPAGTPRDICPKYSVRVIEASSTHAVIAMFCAIYEYAPNRFNKGVEYFLYDLPTATMLSLWLQVADDRETPFPHPTVEPHMKKIANGYQLDWTAVDPSTKHKISMHTKYVRERDKKDNTFFLDCTDLTAPKEEEHGGACEGGKLMLIQE